MSYKINFCKPLDWGESKVVAHCISKWANKLHLVDGNDAINHSYVSAICIYAEAEELADFMASINAWDDRPIYAGKLEQMAVSYLLWVFQRVIINVEEVKNNVRN